MEKRIDECPHDDANGTKTNVPKTTEAPKESEHEQRMLWTIVSDAPGGVSVSLVNPLRDEQFAEKMWILGGSDAVAIFADAAASFALRLCALLNVDEMVVVDEKHANPWKRVPGEASWKERNPEKLKNLLLRSMTERLFLEGFCGQGPLVRVAGNIDSPPVRLEEKEKNNGTTRTRAVLASCAPTALRAGRSLWTNEYASKVKKNCSSWQTPLSSEIVPVPSLPRGAFSVLVPCVPQKKDGDRRAAPPSGESCSESFPGTPEDMSFPAEFAEEILLSGESRISTRPFFSILQGFCNNEVFTNTLRELIVFHPFFIPAEKFGFDDAEAESAAKRALKISPEWMEQGKRYFAWPFGVVEIF